MKSFDALIVLWQGKYRCSITSLLWWTEAAEHSCGNMLRKQHFWTNILQRQTSAEYVSLVTTKSTKLLFDISHSGHRASACVNALGDTLTSLGLQNIMLPHRTGDQIRNYSYTEWAPGTAQWRDNELDGVANHWHLYCLLKRLFGCRSKLRVIGLCEATGERW